MGNTVNLFWKLGIQFSFSGFARLFWDGWKWIIDAHWKFQPVFKSYFLTIPRAAPIALSLGPLPAIRDQEQLKPLKASSWWLVLPSASTYPYRAITVTMRVAVYRIWYCIAHIPYWILTVFHIVLGKYYCWSSLYHHVLTPAHLNSQGDLHKTSL